MRAMVLTAPGELVQDEVARPARAAGDVLVRVTHSGICGTDYKIFNGSIRSVIRGSWAMRWPAKSWRPAAAASRRRHGDHRPGALLRCLLSLPDR